MLIRLIKKITPWIILVGVVTYAFGIAQAGLSVIQQGQINYGSYTWNFWKIDTNQYFKSLQASLDTSAFANMFNKPPTFPKTPNWADIPKILRFIANIFLYVANWIIYIVNITVFGIFKIACYPVQIFLAIFGINTADETWIKGVNMLYTFNIKYIEYL